jgi:phenylalanyl-tRNA synthetase beta chain
VEVPRPQIRTWFEKLGLGFLREDQDAAVWAIPSWRADLEREVDLIEEIARLHGLAAIPARLNYGVAPESPADAAQDRTNRLRRLLAARGWDECLSDSLVPAAWAEGPEAIALANPLNEDYARLRTNLERSLLAAAARNLTRGNRALRLFEIDHVFARQADRVEEPLRLGLLVAGEAQTEAWHQPGRPADFFDLKGTLDFLEQAFGFVPADIRKAGPVAPSLLRGHEIKSAVFFAEIALDRWLAAAPPPHLFQPLATFPEVRRDLAVVVAETTPHADVLRAITDAGVPNLAEVRLFDVFTDPTGEKVAAGRKSLAYALTYRAPDRTLTEREVAGWQDQIRGRLLEKLACNFRDA